MSELKKCFCGESPDKLCLTDNGQGGKWADATCDKCDGWTIEFRTQYYGLDTDKCRELANEYWNEAPRATP